MPSAAQWLVEKWIELIPQPAESSVVQWSAKHVVIPGSARAERYVPDISPQIKEPVEQAGQSLANTVTLIKPTQSAGSLAGEIVMEYWIATWNGGDIGYYMQNDMAARDRWSRRLEKRLRACAPVMRRTSPERFKFIACEVNFPHLNLIVQGAKSDRNVASDSFRGEILEEVHDEEGGWTAGRLEQCFGRQSAYWNAVAFIISNASRQGDQLHQMWKSGTMQFWEVLCPKCKQFHRMHTKLHDDASGLHYDHDACLLPNGDLDYKKVIAHGIFYQFECGHCVNDTPEERRALSMSGRYSDPTNLSAPLTERSYTYQSVSVDYREWWKIIRRKHRARMAKKLGDPKPWCDYMREEECQFIGPEDLYTRTQKVVVLAQGRKKNREGMPNRAARYATIDRQKGVSAEGDLPHWWAVIRDWSPTGGSLLVWEGKLVTDGELLNVLREHEVDPMFTIIDSGFDTEYVYAFCLKYNFSCFKVDGKSGFKHEDGSYHTWSEPVLLRTFLGMELEAETEPEFFHIAKWGAMSRLDFIRSRADIVWEVPEDASEDYQSHLSSWVKVERRIPRTNEIVVDYKQVKDRDDLYQCEAYQTVLAEMDGYIGVGALPPLPQGEIGEAKELVEAQ